jgi:hypothetical protein
MGFPNYLAHQNYWLIQQISRGDGIPAGLADPIQNTETELLTPYPENAYADDESQPVSLSGRESFGA